MLLLDFVFCIFKFVRTGAPKVHNGWDRGEVRVQQPHHHQPHPQVYGAHARADAHAHSPPHTDGVKPSGLHGEVPPRLSALWGGGGIDTVCFILKYPVFF